MTATFAIVLIAAGFVLSMVAGGLARARAAEAMRRDDIKVMRALERHSAHAAAAGTPDRPMARPRQARGRLPARRRPATPRTA